MTPPARTKRKTEENGDIPTAIEQPRTFTVPMDEQTLSLVSSMLQQVNFPDPLSKHVAANLQVTIDRLVNETS